MVKYLLAVLFGAALAAIGVYGYTGKAGDVIVEANQRVEISRQAEQEQYQTVRREVKDVREKVIHEVALLSPDIVAVNLNTELGLWRSSTGSSELGNTGNRVLSVRDRWPRSPRGPSDLSDSERDADAGI